MPIYVTVEKNSDIACQDLPLKTHHALLIIVADIYHTKKYCNIHTEILRSYVNTFLGNFYCLTLLSLRSCRLLVTCLPPLPL